MTTTYLIALSNGLATLPDQNPLHDDEGNLSPYVRNLINENFEDLLWRDNSKPKCKHCSNPRYKDSEYCYPHMVAEERANE